MGANDGALEEYLGCIFFGASWAVMFFWKKITKRKHFLFKGIFCCKFLILKNNSSINGHKLVVRGKCSQLTLITIDYNF
jgi:hypothetical protein